MKIFRAGFLMLLLITALSAARASDFTGWYKGMPITFSGYNPPGGGALTNFPALVTLSTNLAGFRYTDFGSPSDGADLRFAAGNQTDELNYEIENWNTNGTSHVWVNVPLVSGTNTRIWAIWGNPSAAAPACQTNGATWDSSSYKFVTHLGAPSGVLNVSDSSSLRATGSISNNVTATTGFIGSGAHFPGIIGSNYVTYADRDEYSMVVTPGTDRPATISGWVNMGTNTGFRLLSKADSASKAEYFAGTTGPGLWTLYMYSGSGAFATGIASTASASAYNGRWTHYMATYNGSKSAGGMKLYINGQRMTTTVIGSGFTASSNTTSRLNIGAVFPLDANISCATGKMDEVRYEIVERSSNWVWACWLNSASNAAFNAYGDVEYLTLAVQALSATGVGVTNATLNGKLLNGDAESDVYFCLDFSDKPMTSTGDWARVEYAGRSFTNGQPLSMSVNGLLSGSTYVYRCYATNATGQAWSPEAPVFRTIYAPGVTNLGGVAANSTSAFLQGAVTDTGGETPSVWFLYWLAGDTQTNTVSLGQQTGSCVTPVSGLLTGSNYVCMLMASNSAGPAWSAPLEFLAATYLNTYIGTNYGAWEVDSNWSSNRVPAVTDDVLIPGGLTVTLNTTGQVASLQIRTNSVLSVGGVTGTNMALTVHWRAPRDPARTDPVGLLVWGNVTVAGSLAIGGLNQLNTSYLTVNGTLTLSNNLSGAFPPQLAIYAGTTNATTTYQTGGAQVTVAGSTVLASTNSVIYPYCHQKSGAAVVFDLHDLSIATNAQINATGRGYGLVGGIYYGPGATNAGGSFGGRGGSALSRPVYGYTNAPYMAGSPGLVHAGTNGGGGAIRIMARSISLSGKLMADGGTDGGYGYAAGSGGSIWITCSNFTAAGSGAALSAKGGTYTGYSSPAGGGGRIAIMTGSPTAEQITSLYASGTCDNLIVVTTNMADPVTSPYPTLASVSGGLSQNTGNPLDVNHGKPGTAVWLSRQVTGSYPLSVSGSPDALGTVVPAYGTGSQQAGNLDCSAVSPTFVPGSGNQSRLFCTGYTWSNATENVSASGTNVTINITSETWLAWLWGGMEHRLTVRSGGKGSVVQDYNEWYPAGNTATLTAQPDSGCSFLYWVGDVPYADRTSAVITLTMSQPRTIIACFSAPLSGARSLVWAGGSSTNDWFNPANWDSIAIPGVYDTVTVTNGTNLIVYPAEITVGALTLANSARLFIGGTGTNVLYLNPVSASDSRPYGLTVSGNMVITNSAHMAMGGLNATSRVDLVVNGNLSLGGAAVLAMYAAYTGPTNDVATYRNGGAGVTVGGTTTVGANCWVYPFCHQASGAPVIFTLHALNVLANGGFNADYHGFGRLFRYTPAVVIDYYGPGRGTSGDMSGSYGGRGGGGVNPYGYANAPFFPGSPGFDSHNTVAYWDYSGGAIRIHATQMQLDGLLTAKGVSLRYGVNIGTGSGGGIWVTCDSFAMGSGGRIYADGGRGNDYGSCSGGGGGRIAVAVKLTSPQINNLYTTGTDANLDIQQMAASPFASKYSVAGGTSLGGLAGAAGSAVFITGTLGGGTMFLFR